MIKKFTKYFAIATLLKNLIGTKSGQTEGLTQIHPTKIPGRTIFIREKEYFIRESYVENTIPIIFLHSWGSDSLGSWFKILPFYQEKNSFITIDMKNHGKSDSSWMRWDVDENADIVISILNQLGIEKCNLVGWSMGSAVALSISRKKKELVNTHHVSIKFEFSSSIGRVQAIKLGPTENKANMCILPPDTFQLVEAIPASSQEPSWACTIERIVQR